MDIPPSIHTKAANITLLAMDVDGVLTDGKIIYDTNGNEIKAFYVQDGLGLVALKQYANLTLAIITGRSSPMVERRAAELSIDFVIQGRDDKYTALCSLANQLNLSLTQCAYIGDDLPDVRAIMQAGLGISVPNGCLSAQNAADYITQNAGGQGAVREVCELILRAKGQYEPFISAYTD